MAKDDDKELKDGEIVRVPLNMMDAVQRSIHDHFADAKEGGSCEAPDGTPGIWRLVGGELVCRPQGAASTDAQPFMDRAAASLHKPGYRVSTRMLTDHGAREQLADSYEQYKSELCNRYKTASPDPVAHTPTNALLDSEWDDDETDGRERAYEEYDAQLRDSWRTK